MNDFTPDSSELRSCRETGAPGGNVNGASKHGHRSWHGARPIRVSRADRRSYSQRDELNIFSTVAHDSNSQLSKISYGEMSGTSTASPYCAAGLMLFRLVRRDYDGERALDCIKSKSKTDSGVPMLRLKDVLDACPVTR